MHLEHTAIAAAPSSTKSWAPGTAAAELAELIATWEQRHAQMVERDVAKRAPVGTTSVDAAAVPLARDAATGGRHDFRQP